MGSKGDETRAPIVAAENGAHAPHTLVASTRKEISSELTIPIFPVDLAPIGVVLHWQSRGSAGFNKRSISIV
jgi:hypothetical protein